VRAHPPASHNKNLCVLTHHIPSVNTCWLVSVQKIKFHSIAPKKPRASRTLTHLSTDVLLSLITSLPSCTLTHYGADFYSNHTHSLTHTFLHVFLAPLTHINRIQSLKYADLFQCRLATHTHHDQIQRGQCTLKPQCRLATHTHHDHADLGREEEG